jgi:hypothetical protein
MVQGYTEMTTKKLSADNVAREKYATICRHKLHAIADFDKCSPDVAKLITDQLVKLCGSKNYYLEYIGNVARVKTKLGTRRGAGDKAVVFNVKTVTPVVGYDRIDGEWVKVDQSQHSARQFFAYSIANAATIEKIHASMAHIKKIGDMLNLTEPEELITHEFAHLVDGANTVKWDSPHDELHEAFIKYATTNGHERTFVEMDIRKEVGNYIFHTSAEMWAECYRMWYHKKLTNKHLKKFAPKVLQKYA